MTRRAIGKAFLLGAALTTLSISLSAQRTITRLVYISAVDEAETAVLNLTNADFRITENGLQREVTRATLLNGPMRIVLLVDSSTPVGPMLNNFRTALNAFIDELPEEEEVVFVSSGGQIRVRTQPGTDRVKLRTEVAHFAAEGGANAFLDTMLEADKRFLKTVPPGQWPAFVIVTTDRGENTREPNVKDYNNFMQDFLARGGAAHAVNGETWSVFGINGNDTGGIIPWSPEAEANALDVAQANCSQFNKYAVITSVHRVYGDYIAYACWWHPPRGKRYHS